MLCPVVSVGVSSCGFPLVFVWGWFCLVLGVKLNQEERKILKISHVGWISVAYSILPFIMLSMVTGNAEVIKIGKLDSFVYLICVIIQNWVDGYSLRVTGISSLKSTC